jgi:hypothetical protein
MGQREPQAGSIFMGASHLLKLLSFSDVRCYYPEAVIPQKGGSQKPL